MPKEVPLAIHGPFYGEVDESLETLEAIRQFNARLTGAPAFMLDILAREVEARGALTTSGSANQLTERELATANMVEELLRRSHGGILLDLGEATPAVRENLRLQAIVNASPHGTGMSPRERTWQIGAAKLRALGEAVTGRTAPTGYADSFRAYHRKQFRNNQILD